jgi:hypothetical protein
MTFILGSPLPTGAFDPASLVTGGGGFWRADMGVTQSSGNVTQWNDQSGNGLNLTVPGSPGTPISPTFSSTGFNNYPGISVTELAANYQALTNASVNFNSGTWSFFWLINIPNYTHNVSYDRVLAFLGNGQSNDFGNTTSMEFCGTVATIATQFQIQWSSNQITPSFTTGVPLLLGLVDSAGTTTFYINNVSSGTLTVSNLGSASPGTMVFGSVGQGGSTGQMLTSTTAWFLLTSTALTAQNMSSLASFSNANWGTSF